MTDTKLAPQDPRRQQIQIVLDSLNSPNTYRAYNRTYQDFLKWHDANGQKPFTRALVQKYRAYLVSQDKSPTVINQAIAALKKLAFEMAENGILDHNTYASIETIKGQKYQVLPVGRHIESGEIDRLLESCQLDDSPFGIRDTAIVGLLHNTGMRRSEIVSLDLSDFDSGEGKIIIRGAKGNKDRVSYLRSEVVAMVNDWLGIRGVSPGALFCRIYKGGKLSHKQLTGQAIHYILKNRKRQAGLDDFTPHDLRRTFISNMLDQTDVVTVARIVGHSNTETTGRYDRRPERAMKEAVDKMRPLPYRKRDHSPAK